MSGILLSLFGGSYGNPPLNTDVPTISGTVAVGSTLTSTTGTWTGDSPITYTYQWQRNTSNISGATSSTYTIVIADAGNTLRCRVTATNNAGSTQAFSANTTTVPVPKITGANGGVQLTPGNGYVYHVFTGPDNFNVLTGSGEVDYLIVGGGGGSGGNGSPPSPTPGYGAGGGGGGGVRTGNAFFSPGPNPIVVGAAGTAGPTNGDGGQGGSTTFLGLTSTGGGGGGAGGFRPGPSLLADSNGQPGGSGGGGGSGNPPTKYGGAAGTGNSPPTSPPQGNPGGAGGGYPLTPPSGNIPGGGGGGGAGGSGGTAAGVLVGGNGGAGRAVPIFPGPILAPAFGPAAVNFSNTVGPTGLYGGGGGGRSTGGTPGSTFGPPSARAGGGGSIPGVAQAGLVVVRYLA